MLTKKRAARKVALNERLNIIYKINDLEFANCHDCPMFKDLRQAVVKCDGCKTFNKIKKIGSSLNVSTNNKRVDVMYIEEERHDTTESNPEVYIKCIVSYKDKNGYDFKEGDVFIRDKEFVKSRVTIQDSKAKSINISTNMYYSKFCHISKEEKEKIVGKSEREKFVVIKEFKTRCGKIFKLDEVWIMEKRIWENGRFLISKDEENFEIARDSLYRNFDKLGGNENE